MQKLYFFIISILIYISLYNNSCMAWPLSNKIPTFEITMDTLKDEIYNAAQRIKWIEIYENRNILEQAYSKSGTDVIVRLEPGYDIVGLSKKYKSDRKLVSISVIYTHSKDTLNLGISHFNILCRVLIETVMPNITEQEVDEIFSLSGLLYGKSGSVIRKYIKFICEMDGKYLVLHVQKIK